MNNKEYAWRCHIIKSMSAIDRLGKHAVANLYHIPKVEDKLCRNFLAILANVKQSGEEWDEFVKRSRLELDKEISKV